MVFVPHFENINLEVVYFLICQKFKSQKIAMHFRCVQFCTKWTCSARREERGPLKPQQWQKIRKYLE